jgi:hypothetical protein
VRVCVHKVSAHTCMSISVSTVFLKKEGGAGMEFGPVLENKATIL